MPESPRLRPARDTDAEGFIALIAACWSEYPGCILDVDGELPELRALATHYAKKGGALWSAEHEGKIVGMTATAPLDETTWEIAKVYVAQAHRGTNLAQTLMQTAESHASAAGATQLKLWTDTRFTRAHAFYEKLGYVRQGPIRVLHDISNSLEFPYAKPATGTQVWQLDAAGAASAERPLAEILKTCVEDGAAITFLPPLPLPTARGFYKAMARDVAAGTRLLFAGWVNGTLAGTVSLNLDMPPNQPHRAEVQKLMVHPAHRRHGLANHLMQAAEQAAREANRTLLTLDTRADDSAEQLYLKRGYTPAGRIPGYALNADGTKHAATFFWKDLA